MTEEKNNQKNDEENSTEIAVPLAAISGVLFGIGAIFLKMATGTTGAFNVFSSGQWATLLGTASFWGMILANGGGIVAWFWALSEGRVAVVGPFMSGFMVMVPVIVGLTYFSEPVTVLKGLGILTITAGGMLLSGRS